MKYLVLLVLTIAALAAEPAAAHDKKLHTAPDAPKTPLPPALGAGPFAGIGGPFDLVDHHGNPRSDRDFRGRFMLIFFGYATCQSICPVGLGRMTAALDMLDEEARVRVQPLLITVDPENDTPETLAQAVPKIHPKLLGLTGTPAQLQAAMRAFQVESKQVSTAANGDPIYSHGSYIYLIRPDGSFATLLPPVLGEDQIAEILRRYVL